MAIKIEMLRCFSIVAQAGTLSEAAERLGRTQSAVSMTLKNLEEHLGSRLFESDRKNRLTPLGEQVFELARAELRQFDETVRTIEASARAPQGVIRIVAVPSVASVVFPVIVEAFVQRYPGIDIELSDADSQQVVDALTGGHADIGIASPKYALNGVQTLPLLSDPFGLICSANHPLARQTEALTVDQVLAAGFVRNDLCLSIGSAAFQAATARAKLSARNTLSLIAMIRSGHWVSILPRTVARIAPSDLVFRPITDLPDHRQVDLLLREKTPFYAQAKEMCEIIQTTQGKTPDGSERQKFD